jgi:hypothetical protein
MEDNTTPSDSDGQQLFTVRIYGIMDLRVARANQSANQGGEDGRIENANL